jgi:hypothetical protein
MQKEPLHERGGLIMDGDGSLDRVDVALIPLKAALNMVPVVGGSLAGLIGDCMARFQQEAMKKAVAFLEQKVAELGARIDNEAINKDDFAELFGKYAALAATTSREEKLRAASNILANALLPPGDPKKSLFDELDHLMHCVSALSSGAIALLGASVQIANQLRPVGTNRTQTRVHLVDISQKLPDLSPQLMLGLVAELRSLNLLHVTEGAIAAPDLGHYAISVTSLGFLFAERFVEGRM